jgi:hypothetical protein
MGTCPKCKKQIETLMRLETREFKDVATYDPDSDTLEYEPEDEWTGNGYGNTLKEEFRCPECEAVLFTTEEEAKKFLTWTEAGDGDGS